jgi:chemotaxis response regulator CheB
VAVIEVNIDAKFIKDRVKLSRTDKKYGAKTIAKEEKSCVVYGMPEEAVKLDAADRVLSLESIAPYVLGIQ